LNILEYTEHNCDTFEVLIITLGKVNLEKIDSHSIKKVLIEMGSPIIPLSLIFDRLGFGGVTGLEWGILAGAVTVLAIELGYKVEKIGRSIILRRAEKGKIGSEDEGSFIGN
jgi:hypothetical protein